MTFKVTEPAARDIAQILRETMKMFGAAQLAAYQKIIQQGLDLIRQQPERPGSIEREDIAPGVRLFHLELAAARSRGAAHCLLYKTGGGTTIILRVLHEHMEPRGKVLYSLRKEEPPQRP